MTTKEKELKPLNPYMFRKSPYFKSDSPTQRGSYDRGHSQTRGGNEAYLTGEKPLSYWSKKSIQSHLTSFLRGLNGKDLQLYHTFLKTAYIDTETLLKELMKCELKELQLLFLEYSGVHYTGNYFRYTHFYKFTDRINTVLPRLRVKPVFSEHRPIQLKLPLKIEILRNVTEPETKQLTFL